MFLFFFQISDEEEEIERLAVNFVTFSAEKWTKSAADWSRGVIFFILSDRTESDKEVWERAALSPPQLPRKKKKKQLMFP